MMKGGEVGDIGVGPRSQCPLRPRWEPDHRTLHWVGNREKGGVKPTSINGEGTQGELLPCDKENNREGTFVIPSRNQ